MKTTPSSPDRAHFPWTVLLTVALTSAALSALVAHRVSSRNGYEPPPSATTDQVKEILFRVEAVERRLAGGDTSDIGSDDQSPTGEPADNPSLRESDVLERLARLEQIESERQENARRRSEQRRLMEEARRAQLARVAAAATNTMLDPAADDSLKAAAWRDMRMNAAEFWDDTVVGEAVRIGLSAEDPQLRADIWRQAHANHTHPLLLQPLLQAVASDPHRNVREEAAETLDLYLDQPGVREALQTVSQYDADPGVRRQATISLAGPQGGF